MKDLLSQRELSQLLRSKPETIRRWANQQLGGFPYGIALPNGRRLWPREDIEQWLAEASQPQPEQQLDHEAIMQQIRALK